MDGQTDREQGMVCKSEVLFNNVYGSPLHVFWFKKEYKTFLKELSIIGV